MHERSGAACGPAPTISRFAPSETIETTPRIMPSLSLIIGAPLPPSRKAVHADPLTSTKLCQDQPETFLLSPVPLIVHPLKGLLKVGEGADTTSPTESSSLAISLAGMPAADKER